jgi:hypothetical protein
MPRRKGETFEQFVSRMAAEESVSEVMASTINVGSDQYLARLKLVHKEPRDEVYAGVS